MTLREKLHVHRHKLIPLIVTVTGAVLVAVFWRDLAAWFTGQPVTSATTGATATALAGPFEVAASLQPDPPREKRNTLHLGITDKDSGAAIDAAHVTVTYRMPAMGAMQEMRGSADVAAGGAAGQYLASFDLPMAGSYSLEISVESSGRAGDAALHMTVGTRGLTVTSQSGTRTPSLSAPEPAAHPFDDATLERLRAAFSTYEEIRALLARDSSDGLADQARALGAALDAAAKGQDRPDSEAAQYLGRAVGASRALEKAGDASSARGPFGELSMHLVALAETDPRLADGFHIFKCPMTEGFQKWFQRSPRLDNPYMGQRMPECGVRSDWSVAATAEPAHAHPGSDEVAYHTCSMHPSVRQASPGNCPICGMKLTPVTRGEAESGTIFVDEIRRQRIGVRTAPAVQRTLTLPIRAVGQVRYDETRLADVNLRMSGWVQKLVADQTGQRVRQGQTLFTLYSPELYAAQIEYLTMLQRQQGVGQGTGQGVGQGVTALPGTAETFAALTRAARQRLRLLGLAEPQIRELEKRKQAAENIPILSPASGFVIEKNVVEGGRVEAGALVYRIADLARVWIDAEVYEADLPHVRTGQKAVVELPYVPGKTYQGRVDYIYPTLEGETRTGRVRVVLDNRDLVLKPDMYASVKLEVELGERLVVPDSAVIYTGPRRLVFVDVGEGRLRPREIELGVHAAGFYEVTTGLEGGEVVVTSGNFLIAAESRIRSAAGYWEASDEPR